MSIKLLNENLVECRLRIAVGSSWFNADTGDGTLNKEGRIWCLGLQKGMPDIWTDQVPNADEVRKVHENFGMAKSSKFVWENLINK